MIKPGVKDLERKVVFIGTDGQGKQGTLKGLNRRGVFVMFDGKGNLELVNRKHLHWGPEEVKGKGNGTSDTGTSGTKEEDA